MSSVLVGKILVHKEEDPVFTTCSFRLSSFLLEVKLSVKLWKD